MLLIWVSRWWGSSMITCLGLHDKEALIGPLIGQHNRFSNRNRNKAKISHRIFIVYPRRFMHSLHFLCVCHTLVMVNFHHILQGCFTGTGEILDCPSACEATLEEMSKSKYKSSKLWPDTRKCNLYLRLCEWYHYVQIYIYIYIYI